jgi:hypothetical protein
MRQGENEARGSKSCVMGDPHVTQELDVPVTMLKGQKYEDCGQNGYRV